MAYRRQYESLKKYGANIAEMNAVKTAIKAACSNGVTDLTIFYDWSGLKFFSCRANIKPRHQGCPCYAQYADFVEHSRKTMRIHFSKVKAHAGIPFNILADSMARARKAVKNPYS